MAQDIGFTADFASERNTSRSINFLLAYFDANAHCGLITQSEIEAAMDYVCDNHEFE